NYLTYDTAYYHGQPYYVDTFQTEKVWISIARNLKDSLPVSKLSYLDRWVAFSNNPFATTYTPLVDTPFVAFFTAYDSIRQLRIAAAALSLSVLGCFSDRGADPVTAPTEYPTSVAGLAFAKASEPKDMGAGETFVLDAAPVKKVLGGKEVRMVAYNGSIPGPL